MSRFLPFLSWRPFTGPRLRADAVAGITVALVLVPQSMAYAQLAGLPAHYGLYAACVPVIVGALFGSSHQLATGPVAMVSLLTGSTLAQFAATGSDQFIVLAILLSFLVGVMQLALGVFRLGSVVSFLSHPVIVGFTNGAAIIIFLSQLNKLMGVPVGRSEHFLADVWGVVSLARETHWPTFVIGATALATMLWLRKRHPRVPGVLLAVAVTTVLSWTIGFERKDTLPVDAIGDPEVRQLASDVTAGRQRIARLENDIAAKNALLGAGEAMPPPQRLALQYEVDLLRLTLRDAESEDRVRRRGLRKYQFVQVNDAAAGQRLQRVDAASGSSAPGLQPWRIQRIEGGQVHLIGGGEVVGHIPPGLPEIRMPGFDWNRMLQLLSTALVITLVGFMEAISVAKAMATKTRQRIDPSQELIGQGLANLAAAFTQSQPVSGSFSRSAVNLSSGAVSGLSSVFTFGVVVLTLLLLTPLLYHLPQSVLAAVIMLAALSLLNFGGMRHAWEAHRHDGIAAWITFAATLGFAPHLDTGILVGGGLAIVLYLYRSMAPRVAVLARHADGTLREASLHGLPLSEHVVALRFYGALYFANVPYFEDAVLEAAAAHPTARWFLIAGDTISELDASGEEVIRHLVERLDAAGVQVVFSGLKKQVLDVMRATGLEARIGPDRFFRTEDQALESLWANAPPAAGGARPDRAAFLLPPR